jgi:hypothetical protein
MPSWDINFLKAELNSAALVVTGSTVATQTIFIPQMYCDVQYVINKFEADIEASTADPLDLDVESGDSEIFDETIYFSDGSHIEYEEDFVLLKVEEANTAFVRENFEIEVYEIMDIAGSSPFATAGDQSLKKLLFTQPNEDPTTDNVEYYFDILFDGSIDDQTFCKLAKEDKINNIYFDRVFTCPDTQDQGASLNVYGTDENEPEGVC